MFAGRRRFLVAGAAVAGLGALPFLFDRSEVRAAELRPDPGGVLNLREGFTYRVLDRRGQEMTDGYRVPARPDGMACFPGDDGRLVLMRNHELSDPREGPYPPGQAPPQAYDPLAPGGVTRLVLDSESLEVVSSNLVLAGTLTNCAGGMSPWGWLSCEESSEDGHGYVFVCPTDAERVAPHRRVVSFGRFRHEAAVVDPETRATYFSEDRPDGAFYRLVPDDPERPFVGRFQALALGRGGSVDTSRGLDVGDRAPVRWVDIDDPDPAEDTLRFTAREAGAATFCRGEGLWWHEGSAVLSCTSGGPAQKGQIFRLTPTSDGGELELLAQAVGDELDYPDNVTVAPWGDIYIAEDGRGDQYLRVLAPDGRLRPFARNALSGSELTGVCFSPDGGTLFVSLQHDGVTLAIRGDFRSLTA